MRGLRDVGYAALLALAAGVVCLGQTERGSIRGTVEDSTGAVIPGATVTATNSATGVQATTASTESGNYSLPNLPAGYYTVAAEKTGFKRLVRENVKVDVASVTGLDLQVQVGEVTESVTVSDAAPQLRSETSSVATSINPKTYLDLPLAAGGGRSPEAFIFLAPGTSGDTFDAHINGSQTLSKEIQVEGLSMAIAEVPGDPRTFTMPPDAIQEFSITTSSYSAEFGNSGGGIGQFTVRSGTNDFHGSAYEFFRNDKLNARGFFLGSRPIRRENEFGFSIGGPIRIPKIYNGQNRSFFFFNYNNFKFRSGPANQLGSVPTAAFKRGDFGELRDNQGNLIPIYDPASTRSDGQGGFTRTAFPNNVIPPDRISTVARNILGYVPDPQFPEIVNNYLSLNKNRTDKPFYTWKLDHNFNANHRISGMWNMGKLEDNGPIAILPPPIASTRDSIFTQKTLRLSYDWTLSPTMINHAAAGFNRQNQTLIAPEQGGGWAEKVGLRGVPNGAFVGINFAPLTALAQNQEYFTSISNTYLLADSLTWIAGKHNIKIGVDYRRLQDNFVFPSTTGNYNFDRTGTAFPSAALRSTTGNAFASFLLGYVNNGGFRVSEIGTGGRWGYFASYIQDDYKLTPRITLNLGLRWDLHLPLTEANDLYSIMDPTVPNPRAGGILGAVIFAGEGQGRTGRSRLTNGISYNNWGPRLGLAWKVNEKTVFRGGYGIGYFPQGALGGGNVRAHAAGFEATANFLSQDQGLTPAFLLDSGFPQNYDRPPFIDPGYNVGLGVNMWNDNAHEPMYRQDFNAGIQYQIANNLLLDFGWVGQKSTRLNTGVFNANQVHPSYLRLGELLTRNINDPAVAAAGFRPPFAGFTGTLAQSLRPFPQYTGVGILNSANIGNSTYHSLQVKLEKQYSSGLFLLSSYTWSKSLTDASSVLGGFFSTSARDHYNRRIEKALATYDVPSRLVMAMNYELPLGPGKRYASGKGVVSKVVGGWQVNAVLNYQSGQPIGVGVNNTLPLFNSRNLPDMVAGVNPLIENSNFDPAQHLYMDINAFRNPAPFTFGNAPSVLNVRNFRFFNENIGVIKRTYFTETINLEFRFEMFNVFNRVRFGGPATNVNDPFNFGKISSQANAPRDGQLALKFNF